MRIGVISTSQLPSNTANSIQVAKVCQAYKQIGHDVTLFVPGRKEEEWETIKKIYGLSEKFSINWIRANKAFHRYDFALKVIIKTRNIGFDIIHTWTPQVAIFLNLLKIPYFLELHELPTGRFGPLIYRTILKSKFPRKKFLPITKALQNRFEHVFNFKFSPDEVVISPDGVDIERYSNLKSASETRIQLGLPDKYSAVYTGHLYTGRGMSLLLELAKLLPDINFIWVGGRQKDVLLWENKIQESNIGNIILTGFVDNELIPNYQAAGDVLLMPYEKEISGSSGGNTADYCSPMKMFEYLATGRPIISSDLPVLHEVLNTNNALFCKSDDPICWKNEIIKLINFPDIAKNLSRNAIEDARKYTWIKRCLNGLEKF